ncbi:glutathione transferase [Oryzomicrobium sp.]|uniref:glutathione transferase n=1 Tax=Oryzomicrobium sp. TaxID=1911578 RepID=UPI0025D6A3FB|nr:glutathione transferase [Oryzomicrobium sp.]MCE1241670.1 glutathione transferase [Oryzomicrobium sp.]
MSRPNLRLYVDAQFVSPYGMSAFVALHEKGLPFELVPLNLAAKETEAPHFAAQSITRRVPTLIHGDFALSESSAIAEYVDEVFPGTPLYPANVRDRARARQIQAWLRSDLVALRNERSTEVVFLRPVDTPLSREAQVAADKLIAAAELLLPSGETNLFGDWSIADTDLSLMLNRLVLNGDPVPAALAAYARRQWQRPSVQLWVGRERPTP